MDGHAAGIAGASAWRLKCTEGPALGPSYPFMLASSAVLFVVSGAQPPAGKLVVDPVALRVIGRMGGVTYTRPTQLFELGRPTLAQASGTLSSFFLTPLPFTLTSSLPLANRCILCKLCLNCSCLMTLRSCRRTSRQQSTLRPSSRRLHRMARPRTEAKSSAWHKPALKAACSEQHREAAEGSCKVMPCCVRMPTGPS